MALADRVAVATTEAFYGALRQGSPPAEALRTAQRTIRATPRYAHPYYWAPLTLWGDASEGLR